MTDSAASANSANSAAGADSAVRPASAARADSAARPASAARADSAARGRRPVRLTIDPWDPAYGAAVEVDVGDFDLPAGEVDVDVEIPAERWAPVNPPGAGAGAGEPSPALGAVVVFVDGVRRVDAHVWIEGGSRPGDDASGPGSEAGGAVSPAGSRGTGMPVTGQRGGAAAASVDSGVCASYAAGAIRCDGRARLVDVEVGRALVAASAHLTDLPTAAGTFRATAASAALPAQLSLALQQAMGDAEARVAARACDAAGCELVVVDGPLRGRAGGPHAVDHAIGFVKTHHVAYLPSEQHRVVSLLSPGQRTPLFTLGTSWNRYSWYLRLPGASGSPWAGVVRCECSPEMAPEAARRLADLASTVLPRYASDAYKDARAPQNLYPIGALERELRLRLGDPLIVYRALRVAAARSAAPPAA